MCVFYTQNYPFFHNFVFPRTSKIVLSRAREHDFNQIVTLVVDVEFPVKLMEFRYPNP